MRCTTCAATSPPAWLHGHSRAPYPARPAKMGHHQPAETSDRSTQTYASDRFTRIPCGCGQHGVASRRGDDTATASTSGGGANATANEPPTVVAGFNKVVTEGSTVTLSGTASDADNDTLTYSWSHNHPGLTLSGGVTLSPSFTAPAVDSDTTVTFTLAVFDGTDTVSDSLDVIIANVPPGTPQNLQATSTSDSVTLTWDDPGDDSITGYKIMSRTPATQSYLSALVSNTGSAGTSYTVENLEPDTAYVFRIIAINGDGASSRSDSVRISTTA